MRQGPKAVCSLLAAVGVFLSFMLSAGCNGAKEEEEAPIRVAITDDIVTLDAAEVKDVLSESVARCIYTTLYTFDEELNLVPSLAESAERVSDLVWMFHLQKNAKFQDGSPLTADDVKFSVERAMSAKLAEKSLLMIKQMDVLDPYTLQVTTQEPCANLPSVFVRVSTSVMSKKAMETPGYDMSRPVGSGPFRVLERKVGESIRLERFDGYYLEPAKTKYLDFLVDTSEQNRTAGVLNQKYDVVFRISSYDCDYLKVNEEVQVYEHDSTKMELFCLNPDYPPLDDLKVRQAIAHAIDKQNLVDNVLDSYGATLESMLPPPLPGAIESDNFAYDPDLSRQLLREAGYEDGFDMTVLTFDVGRKKMMEYIRLDLDQVGIRLNYEFLDLNDYVKAIEQNRHMSTLMNWTSNADPDSTFSQIYSKDGPITINHSQYSDKRVEALILKGREESDPEKRQAIYQEANRIVADSYFVLPLCRPTILVAAVKSIGGVRVNPQGIFGFESLFHVKNA